MTTPSPQCPQCLRNISSKHSPFRDQAVCANRNCTLFLQRLNQQYPRDYFKAPRGNSLEEQILDRRAQLQAYQYRLKLSTDRKISNNRNHEKYAEGIKLHRSVLRANIASITDQISTLMGQEADRKIYAAYRRSY